MEEPPKDEAQAPPQPPPPPQHPLPPLPPLPPTQTPGQNDNPLGSTVSPPGMRLRSGKKKKPTPMKSGKRHRGYNTDDEYDSDASVSSSVAGSTSGGVGVKRRKTEKEEGTGEDDNPKDTVMKDDTTTGSSSNEAVPSTIRVDNEKDDQPMETIEEEQNEAEVAETAEKAETEEAAKPAETAKPVVAPENGTGENAETPKANGNGKTHTLLHPMSEAPELPTASVTIPTPTAAAAAEAAANITATGNADVTLAVPSAAAATAAAAAVATTPTVSITSPPAIQLKNLRLPSQHTPAPPKLSAPYQGTTRLRDFNTPGTIRARASPAFSNGTNGAGTDSEVERLELKMVQAAQEVEEENEEREEGRRDALVHHYFKEVDSESNDIVVDDDSGVPKEKIRGGMGVFGLCCIFIMLHGTLAWMSGSLVRPMFILGNLSGCADQTVVSYESILGIEKEDFIPEQVDVEDFASEQEEESLEEEDEEPEPEPEPEQEPEPVPPQIIEVEEIVENIVWIDNVELENRERELLKKRRMIEEWKKNKDDALRIKNDFQQKAEAVRSSDVSISSHMDSFKAEDAEKLEELKDWEETLRASEDVLNALTSDSSNDDAKLKASQLFETLMDSADVLLSPSTLSLISTDTVHVPGERCAGQDFTVTVNEEEEEEEEEEQDTEDVEDTPVVFATEADVEDVYDELDEVLDKAYSAIFQDPEIFASVEKWVNRRVNMLANGFQFTLPDIDEINVKVVEKVVESEPVPKVRVIKKTGLTKKEVQTIIDEQVEVFRADTTGEHDYASLRSGAKVIHSGPRQTSASLIENLPLINQLMGKIGLKFYGHGAYAALEPTYPKDSLGQCWSFEQEGERKRITINEFLDNDEMEDDPDRGEYATLAVKLARPVFVKKISIEHTKKALSPNRGTAIRNFRVVGFQDDEAMGNPWLLGEFEYLANDKSYLQEFEVKTTDENGRQIPKLSSIVLAIDSNWGSEYSCLYRFRVNGSNKKAKL